MFLGKILGLLFGYCLVCSEYQNKFGVCEDCAQGLKNYNRCFHDVYCRCGRDAICYFYNKTSRRILLLCKYADNPQAIEFIANAIIKKITHKPDLIIPVPTSRYKLLVRGYNPVAEIGKLIAKKLKIPLVTEVMIKSKNTSQRGHNKAQRIKNTTSIKLINPELIKNKTIAILDDNIASGATMKRMQSLLIKHAKKVFFWSFSKT
jgi:predicted amidophosphoribosyltransferase